MTLFDNLINWHINRDERDDGSAVGGIMFAVLISALGAFIVCGFIYVAGLIR